LLLLLLLLLVLNQYPATKAVVEAKATWKVLESFSESPCLLTAETSLARRATTVEIRHTQKTATMNAPEDNILVRELPLIGAEK